ncbi:MAG TPA: hypothetical protein VFK31_06240 [Rhodanobacteraceae bacterium]|nr:hypothetical protein [Rhodanobacteraceae bacterium]
MSPAIQRTTATVWWSAVVLAVLWALVNSAAPYMAEASRLSGAFAPGADYGWALAFAIIFMGAMAAWPLPRADKKHLLLLWAIKATVTLLFVPFYEAHYKGGLDAYMYFGVGALGHGQLLPMKFGDGTANMIGLVRGLTQVLPAYLHLLEMIWSFAGLVAVYLFYRGWRWLMPQLDARALLWIGLFPGILFWSSILGKDPITLLGVGMYFCAIAHGYASGNKRWLLLALLGIAIAAFIRPWYGLILTAPLVAYGLLGRRLRPWQKAVLIVLVAVGTMFAMQRFLNNFQIDDSADLVATSNQVAHSWAYGGSGQETQQFHGMAGMLAFMPFGAFTALFRPLPGEGSGFMLFAGLENVVLLILFARALWRMPLRSLRNPWIAWVVLLLLVWAAMYAFPSAQNLGTAVRFKLAVMPILWPLLLLGALRKPWSGLVPLRKGVART